MFKKYLYKAVMLLAVFSLTISAMGMNTTSARAAGIIYVNTNASGANDGSSWGNAYLTLQDALAAAASGDQIWVAAGVYYPDAGVGQTNNSRSSTFTLINGVQIYGGFEGTEALLSERNISANITILSGDLEQNDTNADADFTAETTGDIVGNNAYHVVRGGDATATTILDGFTITAGNADGPTFDTQNGGGLFNWGTNPTVQNVIFSGNNAEETNFGYGGGVYNYIVTSPAQFTNIVFTGNNAHAGGGMAGDPDIVITDSTFINNTAANTGGGLDISGNGGTLTNVSFTNNTATGGGALNITVGNLTLTNVTFSSNTADSAGAVNVYQGNPEFINVTFDNNTATDFYGGAVQLSQSAPTFRNVTFSNNSANISGGAIFSSTSSDPTLANVTFANNSAVNQGGGFYTGGSSDATLTNVTFSNNSAGLTGGGIYALSGTITLQNTIVANSTDGGDCVSGSVVFAGTGYNLIEDTGADACDLTNGVNGNIIGSDPNLGTLTGSPAYFPLASGSLAINAGDNTACAATPVSNTSQNGLTRPQGTTCDIGSFELANTIPTSATFDDVPMNHPYWLDIEILYANGYTAGCSTSAPLLFCPETTMNRAQSAVFMVRGNFGTSYSPPAAPWTTFGDDFSPGTWAQPWAQGMFDAGLTAGCSTNPRLFCPWEEMPRFQAAVFGMRLKEGINYPPPVGTGTVFADIDGSEWYAGWVEQAYLNGLLPACGSSGGTPLFCPNDLVPRGLAAYMIVRAKNLSMP